MAVTAAGASLQTFHPAASPWQLLGMGVREWLRDKLRTSVWIHRAESITSLPQAIDLIDRFLLGQSSYALEWDDFISWESSHPLVERMRNEIGKFEPLLFAGKTNWASYANEIRTIRDRYAAIIGR